MNDYKLTRIKVNKNKKRKKAIKNIKKLASSFMPLTYYGCKDESRI